MRRLVMGLAAWLLFAAPTLAAPLRVLSYDTYPFLYRDDKGNPTGFEYELLRLFANGRQQELEIVFIEVFDELIPRLERGEGDIASASLTITPERQARVDFSDSYFPVRVHLVEPKGQQSRELKALAGATVATIKGTTYETILSAIPGVQFVYAETERALFEAVASGQAKALAVDSPVALVLLAEFPGLELGMPLSQEQHYGFALKKGSEHKKQLDQMLRQLKVSGIYYRLLEKHFNAQAVEVVKAGKVK